LRSHVLQHFHAVEHTLFLIRRQRVKVVQAFAKRLLALGRQLPEIGVLLEFLLLLLRGQAAVVAKPITGMRPGAAER